MQLSRIDKKKLSIYKNLIDDFPLYYFIIYSKCMYLLHQNYFESYETDEYMSKTI